MIDNFKIIEKISNALNYQSMKVERIKDKKTFVCKILRWKKNQFLENGEQKLFDCLKEGKGLMDTKVFESENLLSVEGFIPTSGQKDEHQIQIILEPYDNVLSQNFRKYSGRQIETIIYSIAKGLKSLHQKKIIHPGLILENIFCTEDKKFKIGGIIEHQIEKDSKIQFCYRPPQFYINLNNLECSANIWSFGILILQLYAKKRFHQLNIESGLQYRNGKFLNEQLFKVIKNPAIQQIVEKMLVINPTQRISSQQIVMKLEKQFSKQYFALPLEKQKQKKSNLKKQIKCQYCHFKGHDKDKCFFANMDDNDYIFAEGRKVLFVKSQTYKNGYCYYKVKQITCLKCKYKGHYANDCPKKIHKNFNQQQTQQYQQQQQAQVNSSSQEFQKKQQEYKYIDLSISKQSSLNQQKCSSCQDSGHQYQQCPDVICNNCQKKGHIAVNCEISIIYNFMDESDVFDFKKGDKKLHCMNCLEIGHISKQCILS